MPKKEQSPTSKRTIVLIAVAILIALAAGLYFFWSKSVDEAARRAMEAERQRYEEEIARLERQVQPPAAPPASPAEEAATPPGEAAPAPVPPRQAAPAPAAKPADPCLEVSDKLERFFGRLDSAEYIAEYQLDRPAAQYFSAVADKLFAHPPVVVRETDDLFTILTNAAHFYRVLGPHDLFLIKDILTHESDDLERVMTQFYRWSEIGPDCRRQGKGLELALPLEGLYNYAGFFLNTLGGQSYLFRRESRVRMLVKYYSVLILDRANEEGINRYGVDIRPAIKSTLGEIEVAANLANRDEYVERLALLQEKYRKQYGPKKLLPQPQAR